MIRVHAFGYYVGDETWSFGSVFTRTIRAMIQANWPVTIQHGTDEFKKYKSPLQIAEKKPGWAFTCNCPDSIELMPMHKRSFYCYWGEHHLKQDHVRQLNTNDVVFVNSSFSKQMLAESGVTSEIKLLHPGYNPHLHFPIENKNGRLRFLFVGQQWRRKGLDVLAAAWQEFRKNRDVRLTVKITPNNPADKSKVEELFRDCPNVEILCTHLPEAALAALYQQHDIFVYPSRSEGFGIPVLEAMACGCFPVVSNYGGYLDFCSSDNALITPIKGKAQRDDGFDVGEWAEPSVENLIDDLRSVIANAHRFNFDHRLAVAESVADFTYANTVEKIKPVFER